jgi:hypothetical protein
MINPSVYSLALPSPGTMLAVKVLDTAQKSSVYIRSNILLKRMKDHVRRREVFVGAET